MSANISDPVMINKASKKKNTSTLSPQQQTEANAREVQNDQDLAEGIYHLGAQYHVRTPTYQYVGTLAGVSGMVYVLTNTGTVYETGPYDQFYAGNPRDFQVHEGAGELVVERTGVVMHRLLKPMKGVEIDKDLDYLKGANPDSVFESVFRKGDYYHVRTPTYQYYGKLKMVTGLVYVFEDSYTVYETGPYPDFYSGNPKDMMKHVHTGELIIERAGCVSHRFLEASRRTKKKA